MTLEWRLFPNLPNPRWFLPMILFICLIFLMIFISLVKAEEIPPATEKIADAIYLAEGGAKTNHPYGILAHYKHTTPKQACINTINHAKKDWNGQGDFIVFLGNRYCPIGAKNDPTGLNKNWIKNVKYFLKKNNG